MLNYYDKTTFIPKVSETGEVTGQIERWEAHEKGILHKAFSVALYYQKQIILQIRKHPVFDSVIDVTASSHPEMKDITMEDEKQAVLRTLKREWQISITKDALKETGSIYYKAKDPLSKYIEHEYCTFYKANIAQMPSPDSEFAHGHAVVEVDYLKKNLHNFNLAPWVVKGIKLL